MGVIKSCKDCTDRYPGCHGKCERYQAERAEYDRLKAAEKARQDVRIYEYLAERRRRRGYGYNKPWFRNIKSSNDY